MIFVAATMPYKTILKETSSIEIVVFVVVVVVLMLFLLIRGAALRRRDRRQSARALLESTIRTNHLTPAEGDLLRRLSTGRSIGALLHDRGVFNEAVERYLQQLKNTGGETPAAVEELRSRYATLAGRLHFRNRPVFSADALAPGSRVKVWLKGKGLFSAEIADNGKNGMWIGLPRWVMPPGVIRKKQEMVVYYWDQNQDYEIHGYAGRVRGKKNARIFMPHSSTVFKGRHPRGMNVETEIPVLFQRILEMEIPEEEAPQLHVLQGRIVSLSVIGAEIRSRISGHAGSLYRFEFDTEGGGRRKHWFIGRVISSEKEAGGNRLYIRFMDIRENTRELIDRFVCRRANRGGVSVLPDAPSGDTRP